MGLQKKEMAGKIQKMPTFQFLKRLPALQKYAGTFTAAARFIGLAAVGVLGMNMEGSTVFAES